MTKRLAPTKETLNQLYALSGNQCAFPGCERPLLNAKNKFIGQVCHIAAASDGGERANLKMTAEERRLPENLLILCYEHHITTDDEVEWTIPKLKKIKADHENQFRGNTLRLTYPPSVIDDMFKLELQRIQMEVSQTLENTEELLVKTDKILVGQENFQSQIMMVLSGLSRDVRESGDFTKEIDAFMDMRGARQQEAALIGLQQFKDRNWNDLNEHDKFRTLANIGILKLELGEQASAGDDFIAALEHEGNTTKGLAMGALGYVLKQNRKEAEVCINAIWEIDPGHPEGWYAFIMLNKETLSFHELLAKIPEEVRTDVDVAFGLVQAASAQGFHAQAIVWAQTALDNTKLNRFDYKAGLATCILQSLLKPYEVISGQVSQDIKEKVRYVIELYSEAWEEIKNTKLAESRAWWLVNRGVARKFFPDPEATYEDLLESVQHNAEYISLRHLAIAALDAEKYDKAISVTERMAAIAEGPRINETELFKSELIIGNGDLQAGRNMLEAFLKRELSDADRYHASIRLIITYVKLDLTEQAKKLNEETLKRFPRKIRPYINAGKFSRNDDMMKEQVKLALSVIDQDTDFNEIYELIIWLRRIEDLENAARLMEQITNQEVLSDFTRDLLEIYYQAGDTEKLLMLTDKLLGTYGPADDLTEYKALIYQQIGDYEQAIKTCEEYLAIYPDDQLIVIRLGMLYEKAGKLDKLEQLLITVTHTDHNLAFFIQKNLALLFFAVGDYSKFLEIGYEARRQFYENADTHKEYVDLLMQRRNYMTPLDIAEVKANTAVTVKIDNQNFETFIIEDRKNAKLILGELDLASPIAQSLLGRKRGDLVEISLATGVKEVELVDIRLKYTKAFHDSLQLLTGKFFQTSGAVRFQVGTSGDFFQDFKPFADLITGAEKKHRKLVELYGQGQLTLGVVSLAQNLPVIEIWRDFVMDQRLGLINQMFYPEQLRAIDDLKANKLLVFDAISLMTISVLNAFDEINLLSNRKIVTQSVFEELTTIIKSLETHVDTGINHLKSIDGQLHNSIESPDTIRNQIACFNELIDWVKTKFDIVPVAAALKFNVNEKTDLDNITGASFADSMITVKELEGLLVSEEKIIRAFASQEFEVNGVNVYTLITYLKDKKKITLSRYHALLQLLIGLNYKIVPMDADSLFAIVEANDFKLEEAVLKASLGIVSPLVLDALPVKTVAEFFYKLIVYSMDVKSSITTLRNHLIIKHCLDVLRMRFNDKWLKPRLLDIIQAKFRFLPIQQAEIESFIITCFEQH